MSFESIETVGAPYLLSHKEVDVWLVPLDPPVETMQVLIPLLSLDERERASRFKFDKDRRRFVVARAALRTLLGRYLHVHGSEIKFLYGSKGKPYLGGAQNAKPRFNVSHSGEFALIAFTDDEPVGVDIELIHEMDDAESVVRRFFSPVEVEQWMGLPARLRSRAFFDCWTRKEAYVKAVGDGLSMPLDRFAVAFRPGDSPTIAFLDANPDRQWSLFDLTPAPGYAGALAIRGSGWSLHCRMNAE